MRLWFVEVSLNGYVLLNMRGALAVCVRALGDTLDGIPADALNPVAGGRLDVKLSPL